MDGVDYQWASIGTKKVFLGEPSRRLFNPLSGDQVLFLINSYVALSEVFSLQEGKNIEYEILNHLPAGSQSEISVFNWMKNVRFPGK